MDKNRFQIFMFFKLFLAVPAEPVFTRRPEAQKVGLNGVAEFHCGASGNPAPTVFWTKEVEYSPHLLQIRILGSLIKNYQIGIRILPFNYKFLTKKDVQF